VNERTSEPGLNDESEVFIPIDLETSVIYLSVRKMGAPRRTGDEIEVGARRPSLDSVLEGLTALARRMGERLSDTGAARVNVEFGCEFAIESGTFVAVVGRASTKSALKVGLEWTKSTT
jgi:hypothetical protein